MKRLTAALVIAAVGNCFGLAARGDTGFELKQTIPLSGVEGRIDHLDLDVAGERLFVCALGNDSLEVIDLRKGGRTHSITGLGAPQGVAYVPELNRLFVAHNKAGLCNIYDASSWQLIGKVDFQDDADNIRYDSASKQIFVGFGNGGIGIINAADGKRMASFKLAAHPEAFELENGGRRVFVNVPNAGHVAVIDRDKGEVTATWKTDRARANFPMALDETNHRLFIGCRNPAELVVLNTDSGEVVSTLKISGDPDDVFYDSKRRRLYAICGAGSVEIIEQTNPNTYKSAAKVPTETGARTGFFVPRWDALFIAVPRRGAQTAEIRRYQIR